MIESDNDIKECAICYEIIHTCDFYAKIESEPGDAVYHVDCLKKWINRSDNGIYSSKKISSYVIYSDQDIVERKILDGNYYVAIDDSPPEGSETSDTADSASDSASDRSFIAIYRLVAFTSLSIIFMIAVFVLHKSGKI